ncbi:MAG: hypothetical protein PVH48_07840, partial [Cyclobacteriaceae bacterium]
MELAVKRKSVLGGNSVKSVVLKGILLILLFSGPARSQELEPRALTNVPIGMNFLFMGYSFSQGDLLLDPALPIEDLDGTIHTVAGA